MDCAGLIAFKDVDFCLALATFNISFFPLHLNNERCRGKIRKVLIFGVLFAIVAFVSVGCASTDATLPDDTIFDNNVYVQRFKA